MQGVSFASNKKKKDSKMSRECQIGLLITSLVEWVFRQRWLIFPTTNEYLVSRTQFHGKNSYAIKSNNFKSIKLSV